MPVQRASLESIEDFRAQKRIAIVGMSHEANSMSEAVFKELSKRGYDVVPVNPNVQEVMGRKCFARMQDIQPPVDAALLMTSPAVTEAVVQDCVDCGIKRIWMHQGVGPGSVSEKAIEVCRERGIRVIPGECPLTFLPQSAVIHNFHGFIRKITGRFPRHAHA
jgi:hypothetical protein